VLQLTVQTISPPVVPWARDISAWVRNKFPGSLMALLKRDFPRFVWQLGELPQEEAGGLGLGLTVLLGAGFFMKQNGRVVGESAVRRMGLVLGIISWIALLAYMVKLGSESTSRLISAYYPLLVIPILLLPVQLRLIRQRWWRMFGKLSAAGALIALVLTPSRPLWPAETACDWLASAYPGNAQIARAKLVYAVYRNRNNLFAPLRNHLPADAGVVGVAGSGDHALASLWQPYGVRQVRYLTELDCARPPDVEWVLINQEPFEAQVRGSIGAWVRKNGGTIVAKEMITAKANHEPETWYVARFAAAGSARR
jgi:hypothetical protein